MAASKLKQGARTSNQQVSGGSAVQARGPTPARRSTKRRRTSEIIDAAARVFAKRGFHGTTTTNIADALGMRQASLYYYFASREAALEAVCERGAQIFVEVAAGIVAEGASPRDKIEALVRAHLEPLGPGLDYVRVFINERRYLPEASRKKLGRFSRRIERLFQAVIEAGISDGSFRADTDPRLAMLAILGMCNTVQAWFEKEDFPLSRIQVDLAEYAARVLTSPTPPPADWRGANRKAT